MTHPPAGPSTPPPPPGPRVGDIIFALADPLGFQNLGHRGPQGVRPLIADSEGRAGVAPVPGAVPFTLPKPPAPPRFGDGPPTPGNPPPPPPQPFPPHPFPAPRPS